MNVNNQTILGRKSRLPLKPYVDKVQTHPPMAQRNFCLKRLLKQKYSTFFLFASVEVFWSISVKTSGKT